MAQFPAMTITTKGQALYAKAQTGTQLSFTKMQAGHGTLPDGQDPAALTALIASDFDINISSIEVDDVNNLAKIQGNQTNTGFLAGVELRELGLFATDPDEGEILYAYANAGNQGDYIPPESSGPFSRLYTINAAIGNAADVTAVIPQETYVTVEEFNEHKAERAKLEELGHVEHGVYNTTLDTTWSGSSAPFTKTQAIAGILATDNPIVDVVMSGTYATDEARQSAWGNIYRITTADGSITLYAKEKPTVSLPIQLKVVR